jgi:Tfp pilus assembly protein PilO
MNANNTKSKIIILGIIFLAILIFDILWFVDIKKSAMEVVELKKFVNQETSQKNNISSIKKDTETLRYAKAEIDSILIQRDSVVPMIEILENIAQITNTELEISNIDISVVKDDDERELYGELKISLGVTGSWDEVNKYLDFIENIPHKMLVNSVRLVEVENNETVEWNMNLLITGITH